MSKPYAIYTDLSGVANLGANNGGFELEIEAQEHLVSILQGRVDHFKESLRIQKRRLKYLKSRDNK